MLNVLQLLAHGQFQSCFHALGQLKGKTPSEVLEIIKLLIGFEEIAENGGSLTTLENIYLKAKSAFLKLPGNSEESKAFVSSLIEYLQIRKQMLKSFNSLISDKQLASVFDLDFSALQELKPNVDRLLEMKNLPMAEIAANTIRLMTEIAVIVDSILTLDMLGAVLSLQTSMTLLCEIAASSQEESKADTFEDVGTAVSSVQLKCLAKTVYFLHGRIAMIFSTVFGCSATEMPFHFEQSTLQEQNAGIGSFFSKLLRKRGTASKLGTETLNEQAACQIAFPQLDRTLSQSLGAMLCEIPKHSQFFLVYDGTAAESVFWFQHSVTVSPVPEALGSPRSGLSNWVVCFSSNVGKEKLIEGTASAMVESKSLLALVAFKAADMRSTGCQKAVEHSASQQFFIFRAGNEKLLRFYLVLVMPGRVDETLHEPVFQVLEAFCQSWCGKDLLDGFRSTCLH